MRISRNIAHPILTSTDVCVRACVCACVRVCVSETLRSTRKRVENILIEVSVNLGARLLSCLKTYRCAIMIYVLFPI